MTDVQILRPGENGQIRPARVFAMTTDPVVGRQEPPAAAAQDPRTIGWREQPETYLARITFASQRDGKETL